VRWPVAKLIPYARNARKHGPAQIAEIAGLIREYGWTTPVLVDDTGRIIAGHGRVLAAHQLGIVEIPAIVAAGWTDLQKRAYALADNEIAAHSAWNKELLRVELADLAQQGVDLETIGFTAADTAAIDPKAGELPRTHAAGSWGASGRRSARDTDISDLGTAGHLIAAGAGLSAGGRTSAADTASAN
jgi:hypothetical protein